MFFSFNLFFVFFLFFLFFCFSFFFHFFFSVVRADAKTGKKTWRSSNGKNDDFLCANLILGPRWTGA